MKVLILGGGGNIGFWVENLLIEDGHYVYSIQRGINKVKRIHLEDKKNFFIIREDINQLSEASRSLINECELIIDFICFNSFTANERLRLFSNFSGLIIMVSTVAVYDRSRGINKLSSGSSCENVQWPYAKNKLEAEKVLLAGIKPGQIKICRLGHTFDTILPVPFGTGDWTFIQWLLDGNSLMLIRDSDSFWPLLHSRDAARRILLLSTEPQEFKNVTNIVNSQTRSWLEIGRAIFSGLGIPERFRKLDLEILRTFLPYWSDSVTFHKKFDEIYVGEEIDKFAKFESTDWSLEKGLEISLDFYLAQESSQLVNHFDYEQFSLLAKKSPILKV